MQRASEALRPEYEAIAGAGFILQIDAPDPGSARHNRYQDLDKAGFLKIAARNAEALNHATRNIAPERMRMHVCWGNYEGPLTHDMPLASLHAVVMKARPAGLLIEGANPAHAHESERRPAHPELGRRRGARAGDRLDRLRVCDVRRPEHPVAPSVVWGKLRALADGARLATRALW